MPDFPFRKLIIEQNRTDFKWRPSGLAASMGPSGGLGRPGNYPGGSIRTPFHFCLNAIYSVECTNYNLDFGIMNWELFWLKLMVIILKYMI
jgi:hypothetical protein